MIKSDNVNLISQIQKYSSDIISTFEQNLCDEKEHLSKLEVSRDKTSKIKNSFSSDYNNPLKCPNCSCSLVLINDPETKTDKLQKAQMNEAKYKQYSELLNEIESNISESNINIKDYSKIIQYYQNICKITEALISEILNLNNLKNSIPKYIPFDETFEFSSLKNLHIQKFECDFETHDLKYYDTLYININNIQMIKSLNQEIESLSAKISNKIEDSIKSKEFLDEYSGKKASYENQIKDLRIYISNIIAKNNKIEQLKKSIININKSIESYDYESAKIIYEDDLKELELYLGTDNKDIKDNNISMKYSEECSRYEQDIFSEKSLIKDYDNATNILEFRDDLEETKRVIYQYVDESDSYQKILKVVENVENSSLYEILDSLNSVLKDITSELFESEMNFKFRLYKENKNGNVKNDVGIDIDYKDINIKNINLLSGGELSRISIATTIAFNIICNSPLLLFDESIGSLDDFNTEKVIEMIDSICIKKYNKTVLIIAHSQIEGRFDSVIHMC
jgi:DNA repair exonuclease SbcCD ATPase subunit